MENKLSYQRRVDFIVQQEIPKYCGIWVFNPLREVKTLFSPYLLICSDPNFRRFIFVPHLKVQPAECYTFGNILSVLAVGPHYAYYDITQPDSQKDQVSHPLLILRIMAATMFIKILPIFLKKQSVRVYPSIIVSIKIVVIHLNERHNHHY